MKSRFGGVMSRAAMTSLDTYPAVINTVHEADDGSVTLTVTTSMGKRIRGVIYGGIKPDYVQSLKGSTVRLSRVGGRWCVI